MRFGANKTPVEVIKKGGFGGIYFRDIYSGANGIRYKKSWKEFYQLKNFDQSIIAQIIMMLVLINMVLSVKHR